MSSEIKVLVLCGAIACGIFGGFMVNEYIESKKDIEKCKKEFEYKLKKAELEGTYPPEYWTAKATEAEAKADAEKARIESQERLKIDARNREAAEREAKREYEKNAPAEYWNQKRIEQEEKTKREHDRLQYESEREAAKLHNKAIEESAKAAERALKRSIGSYSGYNYI